MLLKSNHMLQEEIKMFKCEDGSSFVLGMVVRVDKSSDDYSKRGKPWFVVLDGHEKMYHYISKNDYERLMKHVRDEEEIEEIEEP